MLIMFDNIGLLSDKLSLSLDNENVIFVIIYFYFDKFSKLYQCKPALSNGNYHYHAVTSIVDLVTIFRY